MINSATICKAIKHLHLFLFVMFLLAPANLSAFTKPPKNNVKGKNVLVYTKNGEGFVHDKLPFAVASLEKMAVAHKFKVTITDDLHFFTDENLRSIDLIVSPSTNNEFFTSNSQRLAFRRYIQSRGGIVGIHSAVGRERNWAWFKMLLGGRFIWHPKYQKLAINKIDGSYSSVKGLPNTWVKEDDCYLMKVLYPGIKVIMSHDLTSLNMDQEVKIKELSAPFQRYYPAVWYQDFVGGYEWITALGHKNMDYEDVVFI
jgi:type 1 glutamine amidotransferase